MSTSTPSADHGVPQLCLWSLRYALRRWPAFGVVLLTMFAKIGIELLVPWPVKILVDHVLSGSGQLPPDIAAAAARWLPGAAAGGQSREALAGWCVAATVGLFVLGNVVGGANALASVSFGRRILYDLAADLYGHMQRLSLVFHRRRAVGDLMRRVTADCKSASDILEQALLPVLTSVFSLAAMFLVMWYISPGLTLLSLAVLPLMVAAFRLYSNAMMDASYASEEAEARIYEVAEQTLSAIAIVHAFGAEPREDQRFRQGAQAAVAANVIAIRVQLKFRVLVGLAAALGTAGILWLGATQALAGTILVGDMLVFLSYLAALYAPLEALMYTPSTIQSASGGARRVLEILDTPPDVRDRPGAADLTERARGHVRFDSVTFSYGPDLPPVLRNVTLECQPGQTVAIVGPTGAGKTTLAGLVARFFDPSQGRVTLDGQDLRDVTLASLRRQVALVPQEPFLFPSTVAENIAYGRPDATREQIEAAARAANADEFVSQLPEGYDTVLGERGATLSGGQRQRLSIARALLTDAPVLILDEPTSALDAGAEHLIVEALRRLQHGRTTLIIAHRLSTIRNADAIAVVKDGEVVEQGTHAELMSRNRGAYAGLYQAQFGSVAQPEAPSSASSSSGSAQNERPGTGS
jgi:ATP-binding cassette subfamily B protein/subfamily B ATP-binding cassette protein MsbA